MNGTRLPRTFEALSLIHKGITFAFRALSSSPKAEIQNLKEAIEQVEKGLQVMKKDLEQAERELWKVEHPANNRQKISKS